jgi:hypothetical protein
VSAPKQSTPATEPGTSQLVSNPARVVNPRTGQLLEQLSKQPADLLADTLDAIRERQAELKAMVGALEDELRRRLDMRGRSTALFGEWEVQRDTTREAIWDVAEAEGVLQQLVDGGVLRAGELTGVILRDPVVKRTEMNRVLGQLATPERSLLEACRKWRVKGESVKVRHVEPKPFHDPDANRYHGD